MADGLLLEVVTNSGPVVEVKVDEVRLPGILGELGVLPGHTPLLTSLGIGRLLYTAQGRESQLVIEKGFAEVLPDRVTVLARKARGPEDIDRETEQKAFDEASTALKDAQAEDLADISERLRAAEAALEVIAN